MRPSPVQTEADSTLATCRQAVQQRLARVRRRLRGQLILEGLAWAVGTAVLLAAASLISDRWLRLDLPLRNTLLVIGGLVLAFVAVRRLYRPVSLQLDDLDLAEILERRQPGLGQRLTNVLQLPALQQEDPSASPAMIRAAVREDFSALEQIDLQTLFNPQRRRAAWLLLACLVAPVVVFCIVNPAVAGLWAKRWFAGGDIRWPQQTYLTVVGLGDADRLRVPRGESYLLQVDAQPEFRPVDRYWQVAGRGTPLFIESRERPTSISPNSVSLKLAMADGTRRLGTFTQLSPGRYRYELPPLSDPAELDITGGDDWFGPLRIEPIDRPAVEQLTITAHTPGKSEPEVYRADDAAKQLLFLTGTRLELQLQSTQPLTSARAAISGTETSVDLERRSDGTFTMTWEMKDLVTFEFQLQGDNGLASKPYFLTAGLLNDRPPRLTLRSSGVGRRITPVARIPLHLRAIDDFGVAELSLELEDSRIVDSKPVVAHHRPLEEKFTTAESAVLPLDVNREPTIGLSEFQFVPGTTVRVRGRASDACVLGTQSAESRWLSFQVVTPDELFYEILTRQREQRNRFTKTLETAKEQLDALNRLTAPNEAGPLVRVHQTITRQVWQVAGQLDATLLEMTLNDLGNAAARDLLATSIIRPLRELHDQPLVELRGKLESLSKSDTLNDDRREAAIAAQTETNQRMQRILDQMSQWESFVDVVNQLRHVIRSQDQIRESTEEMQKKQINEVFDE